MWKTTPALIATIALLAACGFAGSASAKMSCGSVTVSGGSVGRVTATVRVVRGSVSCAVARRATRDLFSSRGCYQDNGATVNSYYRVPGGWKGYARMGGFTLLRNKTRIEGPFRVIGGEGHPPPTC